MDERAMSTVTVVVCTGDRRALFEKCVESLLNQTLARDHYEILIVGSESSDDTRLYAEKFSNTDNRVAYLHGKWTTRSEARNAGLTHTGTRCVAFLGEETIPDVNWLENLLQPFLSDRKTMIVGGELSPEWGSDRPVWLKDRWLRFYSVCLNWSAELRLLEQGEWLSYENICFDTDVLKQLGGFPVRPGCQNELLVCGEHSVEAAVKSQGGRIYFEPKAMVHRYIPAEQLTPKWLAKRMFWQGVTDADSAAEKLRLTGEESNGWMDMRLPVSHWEWASLFNLYPDSKLEKHMENYRGLGYAIRKSGLLD